MIINSQFLITQIVNCTTFKTLNNKNNSKKVLKQKDFLIKKCCFFMNYLKHRKGCAKKMSRNLCKFVYHKSQVIQAEKSCVEKSIVHVSCAY